LINLTENLRNLNDYSVNVKYTFQSIILCLLCLLTACQSLTNDPISYNRDIRPILNEKCLACHGGVKQMGGFSLLFEEFAFRQTESGKPAIIRGNHKKSELYKRIVHHDPEMRMPQEKDPLTTAEIALVAQWIDEGAKWEKHWAYVAPDTNLVNLPDKNVPWIQNEIDYFVHQKLVANNLSPNPKAAKSTLIRRVYLDLIGLPPTLEEAQTFFADTDEKALEKLVDELLMSPHFGEHWAAMWLDLARYGDSQGYQKDKIRWHIWRYRDWVINAFNKDLPFDQFTIDQLAGDLVPNPTEEQILATAFHRNTNTNTEGGTDDEEFRTYAVMDRLNTTFEIWQGTTMSCVQCHSHPYDPILHEEFYQGLAFFNNTADADYGNDFPRKKLLSPGQKIALATLNKEVKAQQINGDTLSEAYIELIAKMEMIQPESVPIMKELTDEDRRKSHVFERGNWMVKGAEVQPNIPHILPKITNENAGNRLGLAQWLVHPDNPLTARVIVNRFWKNIFGIGLVETVEDFGTQGDKPVNQELLDWLAIRFVQYHNWSVKGLLKDIVLSATYQQATQTNEDKIAQDANNQLFTRGARFRLSAEQIRDQALTSSGLINREVYGASVMPYLPDGVYSVIRHIHKWKTSPNGNNHRRGLYTFWRKTSPYPSMMSFDTPSREFCVSRRVRTNTPLQAMITLNDPVFMEAAVALAKKMDNPSFTKTEDKISYGFENLLFKKPTAEQLTELSNFYNRSLKNYETNPMDIESLITEVDDQKATFAAMINVANVLLNMDEFIMKG